MYVRTSCIEMDIGQNKLTMKKGTFPKQSAQKVWPYFSSLKITSELNRGTGVLVKTMERPHKTQDSDQALHCVCLDMNGSTAKRLAAGNVMWLRSAEGQ